MKEINKLFKLIYLIYFMRDKKRVKDKEEKKSEKLRLAKRLKIEIKKSVVTAIIAAFGFLIALVWRDVIREIVDSIIEFSPVQGKLISAIIVTLVCVIGILIVSKYSVER